MIALRAVRSRMRTPERWSRRRKDARRVFFALRAPPSRISALPGFIRTGRAVLAIGHRATEPRRIGQRASRGFARTGIGVPAFRDLLHARAYRTRMARIEHACAARCTTAEGRRKLFSAALWLCDQSRHTHAPRVSNTRGQNEAISWLRVSKSGISRPCERTREAAKKPPLRVFASSRQNSRNA